MGSFCSKSDSKSVVSNEAKRSGPDSATRDCKSRRRAESEEEGRYNGTKFSGGGTILDQAVAEVRKSRELKKAKTI